MYGLSTISKMNSEAVENLDRDRRLLRRYALFATAAARLRDVDMPHVSALYDSLLADMRADWPGLASRFADVDAGRVTLVDLR